MYAVAWLLVLLCYVSAVQSSLLSNGTVFTGEIIKIRDDRTVIVRVIKTLSTQERVKLDSTVTLQNSEQDEWLKEPKGVYIFYVVPLDASRWELLHYWSIKQEDFSDIESSSMEGKLDLNCWRNNHEDFVFSMRIFVSLTSLRSFV